MPPKKFVPTEPRRCIYPEEIELFIRCPRLFDYLKKNKPRTSIIQTEIEHRIIVSVIKTAYTQKTRKGIIPTWKKLRLGIGRVIKEEIDKAKSSKEIIENLNLDKITFPLEHWYKNYFSKDFSTSEVCGIKMMVPLNNKENMAASLLFEVPVLYVENKGISGIVYSSSLVKGSFSSLRRNIIARTIVWGISKYVGYNFYDNFNRIKILHIKDNSIDFFNIPIKNFLLEEKEIQYILYGMSNRICYKNKRNECSDCIIKEECIGKEE